MYNKHIIILITFLSLSLFEYKAQDMHFTQFYSAPLYLNPAFTGANVCSRVSMTYRNQWPGIKKTYTSYLLSADHYLPKQKIGVGLLCGADESGSGDLKTTIITPSIAYETKINRLTGIRFGLQPGVVFKSINYNKLIFGDQIARSGNSNPSSVATIETPALNRVFFDMAAGTLIYTSKFWGGVSFWHLTRPNESFFEFEETRLPLKYSVHGGGKFKLNEDEKDELLKKSMSFACHYRGQNEFDQFDVGLYYTQYIFNLGLWYRGIPGLKAYKPGYQNNDALSLIVGIQQDRFSFGYSYDYTISKLHRSTNGAHEISLSYQFCQPKKKKNSRVLISCPKF